MSSRSLFFVTLILLLVPTAAPRLTATPTPAPTSTSTPAITPTSTGSFAGPFTPPPNSTLAPTDTPTVVNQTGQALLRDKNQFFAASGECALCHSGLKDQAGNNLSFDSFWRSSIMANSARDPYWQATVYSEVLDNPALAESLQDTCTKCHMPMARTTLAQDGYQGLLIGDGLLNPENPLHNLAMDGVSCTVCHQIQSTNLGTAESFSGGFVIDPETRVAFGPLALTDAGKVLMQSAGFKAVQSTHIQQSELCATCHTLFVPYVDATGKVVGQLAEQTPYLEWLNSAYKDQQSCQACHMPVASEPVPVANIGGAPPRSPFPQHTFVGGNAFMLEVLGRNVDALGLTASTQQLFASRDRTVENLQKNTATLSIENGRREGNKLAFSVVLENRTGHKFPTGFPSRRAWLHVKVLSPADQKVIFESGAADPLSGAIAGNDNDADPTKYEPHYQSLTNPDQVQVYETISQDTDGQLTTHLLRSAAYVKDNRLLPRGFNPAGADPNITPKGAAAQDKDFSGGDRVEYQVEMGDAKGPFQIVVELQYQLIGYRWLQNLARRDAQEIQLALKPLLDTPNPPPFIAHQEAAVE